LFLLQPSSAVSSYGRNSSVILCRHLRVAFEPLVDCRMHGTQLVSSSAEVHSSAAAGCICNHAGAAPIGHTIGDEHHTENFMPYFRAAGSSCRALLLLCCLLLLGAEGSTCGSAGCCEVNDGVLTSCSGCDVSMTSLSLSSCSTSSIAPGECDALLP
jgi:hypothetical protein